MLYMRDSHTRSIVMLVLLHTIVQVQLIMLILAISALIFFFKIF
jgi:hypothetical protein